MYIENFKSYILYSTIMLRYKFANIYIYKMLILIILCILYNYTLCEVPLR